MQREDMYGLPEQMRPIAKCFHVPSLPRYRIVKYDDPLAQNYGLA